MKKIKSISIALASVVIIATSLVLMHKSSTTYSTNSNKSISSNKSTKASTEILTAESKYINKYTPARLVCGYAKDGEGNALANRKIYLVKGRSQDDHTILSNPYDVTTTDANGYYSYWCYESDYYYVYLTNDNTINDNDLSEIHSGNKEWTSKWIIRDDKNYLVDIRQSVYVLNINRN